ncbi:DUF4240 domain-containing protein [Kitasatospora sp. NPDC057223]|uniref:DUF4240 domain-containing protein n=1 Tax=Kitasatospora sp. NPDC057223 TaxID=3346055 RepID=UPI00363039F0
MDDDIFWQLISTARAGARDESEQAGALAGLLAGLPAEEITAFDRIYAGYHSRAYTWRLWAAGYVINGGCSDDGFHYFRDWLIARGRTFYELALADPDALAGESWDEEEDAEAEEVGYAASHAYERVTGAGLPDGPGVGDAGTPAGEAWEEDDLEELLPRLSARFD